MDYLCPAPFDSWASPSPWLNTIHSLSMRIILCQGGVFIFVDNFLVRTVISDQKKGAD